MNRIKPGINLSRVLRQVDRAELAPPKEKKPEPEAAAPAPEGTASGAAKAGEKGKEKEKEVKKLTKKQRIAGNRRLKMAERREERMRAAAEVPS